MIERDEATIKLFVTHQQLAKPIEPAVCNFDNPPSSSFPGVVLEFSGLLSSSFDMCDIAVRLNDLQCRRSGVTGIRTQVFASALWRAMASDQDTIEYRLYLRDIMAIRPGHDERQRDATTVHQQVTLAPIFFPDPSGWAQRILVPTVL